MDNAYLVAAEWLLLALIASLISIRLGISVALIEILMGVIGGNFLGLHTTSWIGSVATFGASLPTSLAGAKIDSESLRRHARMAVTIGVASFAVPFAAAIGFTYFVAGWTLGPAQIAGVSLSTTSDVVVYAVMIETGLCIALQAVVGSAGLIAVLLAVKVGAKVDGVRPTAHAFGMPTREANYMTLLVSTGLTFGTISALIGLTNHVIDQATCTILVTVVVLSAINPTLIATRFFEPVANVPIEAEEIDVGLLPRPRTQEDGPGTIALPVLTKGEPA